MISRWSLPGPVHYLSRVLSSLREGQNLVLPLPATTLEGLASELERTLLNENWRVSMLRGDAVSLPIDHLFEYLSLNDIQGTPRSVARLRQQLIPGQIVLVHDVGRDSWTLWRELLIEYEVASRDVSAFNRPLFVLIVSGEPLKQMPDQAVALRVLPWKDVVSELDMLLYVHEMLRERKALNVRSRLISRVMARLALWDFELADFLLDNNAKKLFAPHLLLVSASNTLEYTDTLSLDWESGGLQSFDGVEMKHPFLLLASVEGRSEVSMRLWAAQAAEILPAIELHRRTLAQRMQPIVRKPIRINEEEVMDLNDIEIGGLAYIARAQKLSASLIQATEKLRLLRNKLAHLEPLDTDEALDWMR